MTGDTADATTSAVSRQSPTKDENAALDRWRLTLSRGAELATTPWYLLHGTPLTPAVWDETAALLRSSGDVVQPEVTLSERHDSVAQLARALLNQIPRGVRPHLVGHSFGGQVALEMALLAPHRVRTLTMICSRDSAYPAFLPVAESIERGDPIDVDAVLARWFRPEELAVDAPVVGYARRCVLSCDRSTWARALVAIGRFDRSARTPGLTLPLAAIAAEFDTVSTVASMRAMVTRVPQARLTVLPAAGHMSLFLDPARLVSLITRVCDEDAAYAG